LLLPDTGSADCAACVDPLPFLRAKPGNMRASGHSASNDEFDACLAGQRPRAACHWQSGLTQKRDETNWAPLLSEVLEGRNFVFQFMSLHVASCRLQKTLEDFHTILNGPHGVRIKKRRKSAAEKLCAPLIS